MKALHYFLTFAFYSISCGVHAQSDSLSVQQFFDREFKELRAKKPGQIKRIENKDSSIIYGADKARTHLLLVSSHNRITPFHVQFQYNEYGVFCITVLHGSRKAAGPGLKKKNSSYYFDKGKLIGGKGEDGSDDVPFLMAEAERYWRLGNGFLHRP